MKAFSPAGTPFVSGDTSSLSPPPTADHTKKNEIIALIGLDITTLNMAELESHRNDLLRLKKFLLSKIEIQDEVEDGYRGPSQMSFPSPSGDNLEMEELLDNDIRVLRSMTRANCDGGLSRNERSKFSVVESSTGIREDNNNEEFELKLRDLLDDGDANCDMDYGPSRNGGSRFTQVQRNDGIQEDADELRKML